MCFVYINKKKYKYNGFFIFYYCFTYTLSVYTCKNTEKIQTDRHVFLSADDDDRWQKSWLIRSVLTDDALELMMHVSVHRVQPVIKKVCRNKIQNQTTGQYNKYMNRCMLFSCSFGESKFSWRCSNIETLLILVPLK